MSQCFLGIGLKIGGDRLQRSFRSTQRTHRRPIRVLSLRSLRLLLTYVAYIHCVGLKPHFKALTERRNRTELNWRGLVFDELTNEQAVIRYSRRHRLTASVVYVTTLTYSRQPMISGLALLAHWSIRQKLIPRLHDEANMKHT